VDPLDRLRSALADHYAIQREIGRGGMALVFLARDLRHDRDVAIKVLKPEFSMAVSAERFLREIQLEARLKHPYILPLFDSGDVDGLLYYVMPYVQGESLRDRLKRETQLPLPDAFRITGEVAEALAYANAQGVVHRDVKPANILLDENHAFLADFGIARAVSELAGDRLSESGIVVGTPEYMSPEQCTEHGNVDGRSDVYALGCVVYEMLAGEPPFTGPTAQAIVARHLADEPRSLRVVRAAVPEHVEEAIEIALAKVPADRFSTAVAFHEALLHERETVSAVRKARATRRRSARRGLAGFMVAAVGLTLAFWKFSPPRTAKLDHNKVVLFPLAERDLPAARAGAGYDVAVMLSAALEHAQPLRWIDGAQRMTSATTTPEQFRRIALQQRAGFYIDGAVLGAGPESTTVVLRLHDTGGDSVVAQEAASTSRPGVSPVQVGLDAATKLLPRLVDPGRNIDLSPLSSRKPGAIALWIQGERAYRRSRFQDALGFYRRAVGEDSSLAVAALKGAQAAGWENLTEEAERLVKVALRHQTLLPEKQRFFARGWQAYLAGEADSAVIWLRRAAAKDPEWAEVHMALGEVYYHRLPVVPLALDAMARTEFADAVRYDSGFAPPLYHLAEDAIRRDDRKGAIGFIKRFKRFDPDSSRGHELTLMQSCLEDGPASVNWRAEAAATPLGVLQVAHSLSAAGSLNDCAERGFRAVFANQDLPDWHWGAVLGLNGVLASERRYSEIPKLIDSALAQGLSQAPVLYFVDVLAGAPLDSQAGATAIRWRKQYGVQYQGISIATRWLLAAWHAHERDTSGLRQVSRSLLADSKSSSLPIREALVGHLALARGDTVDAVRSFRALRVNVPSVLIDWGLVESLAPERLVQARFALSRGDFSEADRIAAIFDHSSPIVYPPFLPSALAIRLRAAEAMGRSDLVKLYQARMRRLTHHDQVAFSFEPFGGGTPYEHEGFGSSFSAARISAAGVLR
jgi:tetratricopeptide (TPR) repeat protein